jgi:hypothetical protein
MAQIDSMLGIVRRTYRPSNELYYEGTKTVMSVSTSRHITTYYESGRKKSVSSMQYGIRHGRTREWYPDGELMRITWYRYGFEYGLSVYYVKDFGRGDDGDGEVIYTWYGTEPDTIGYPSTEEKHDERYDSYVDSYRRFLRRVRK